MTPEEISDAKAILSGVILHAVNLQKYSNGQVRRILSILNRADADIFAELQRVLDNMPSGTATSEYLFDMLASVRRLNAQAYSQIEGELTSNLRGLAEAEATFQFNLYQGHAPAGVTLAGVTAEQAWAAAYSRPFAGKLLRESIAELGETRARRIRDAVRMGYLEGRTTSQIVRDIRGTRAKGYVEGFLEIDRRHLETMVRTAVQHTAGGVRDRFMEENADVLESQLFVATLDGRTSPPCIARSGKRYTVGERPKPIGHAVPWCTQFGCGPGRLHYNCRSTAVGLLPGQTKLYGTRASANGPVDANMTYGAWLKGQPVAVQDQVLGEKRAALFRSGGLAIDKFFNDKGQYLSLDQLRERDAAAFKRAGVN
ncbi:phage minor head protein [Xenophilus sp. Marseille-Q4582]|uniref:phage minor head protein n=1 Tax=Xenophilus sp. Marseille-Q4582 TaxID=2866600 RepID=UPI001CE416D6|nr:phage minor head protein [Xenophilus sp. Marseille-Q4582]